MTRFPKAMLTSSPNPYKNKAYAVSIVQEITLDRQDFLFGLRYIPDKLLLDHEGLTNYLEQILAQNPGEAETVAHDILDDVIDQIIPRWIEINLRQKQNKFGQNILITIEDRQPGWEDDALLNRLPAIF